MPNETVTISPILSENDTDFSQLLQQGINLVQQYSGSIWTDYNEHDPGITILEELCFVITELYLRTGMPMNDILTGPNGDFPAADNAFYTAAEILHNHPLTPGDFRRIIIDQVREVGNAWIKPMPLVSTKTGTVGITGMYEVQLDLIKEPPSDEIKQSIVQVVKNLLNLHRNVCESFVNVNLLEHELVSVTFDVYVDSSANLEDLLASLLLNMQKYIRPGIDFYTLSQLQERGWETGAIFEGPRLTHGFIPDEELTDRTTEISVAELLKFAFSIQGTRSISNLSIGVTGSGAMTSTTYKVSDGKVAVLDVITSLDNITVYSNNVSCHFNKNLVISKMNELSNKTGQSRKVNLPPQQLDIPIVPGVYRNPGKYFSVQNDFPSIYGIGESGPAEDFGLRKAQALQLKAYLLFFEQTLADYLSQLENIRNVFSTSAQQQTYFYQPVYSVPGITEVVNTTKIAPAATENQYETGLKKLYKHIDNVSDRRKQFLEHLLNRFGIDPYIFSHPETLNEGQTMKINDITVGQDMLQKVPLITSKRGAADATAASASGQWPISGIEEILSLTTGMKYAAYTPVYPAMSYVQPDGNDIWVLDENGTRQLKLTATDQHFFATLFAGTNTKNYVINEAENAVYLNIPADGGLGAQRPLKLFVLLKNTYADEVISDLADDFTNVYLQNEKFFMVDHLQLKPDNNEKVFGWLKKGEPLTQDTYANIMANDTLPQATKNFLYVMAANDLVSSNFYSNRATLVIPKSALKCRNAAFVQYLNYQVATYSPAHLCVELVVLDDYMYQDFANAYAAYIRNEPDAITAITYLLTKDPTYSNMIFDAAAYQ